MPDTRELQPVAEAAEQAAAIGDYPTAERLLRDLARFQETSVGPLHADLANTLNNLGVVCDLADKPDEAERFYRRALAIAKAAFAPDHSFVATSEQNLREFCAARGRPFEAQTDIPEAQAEQSEPVVLPDMLSRADDAGSDSTTGSTSAGRPRPLLILAGVVFVAVAGALVASYLRSRPNEQALSPQAAIQQPAIQQPAVPTTSAPLAGESAKAPATGTEPERGGGRGLRPEPTVAAARVCRNLATGESGINDWPCEGPGTPAEPGSIFFYTRVRSARDTTVEHRWYRGNDLMKIIKLNVRSSPTDGYRTYSHNMVDGRDSRWRVELRSDNGTLLHEERFTVR